MTEFGKCDPVQTETPMANREIMNACIKVRIGC